MNKKLSALFALTSLLLSSCTTLTIPTGIPHGEQGEGGKTPEEVVFNVTSSKFIDEEGHLEVSYSCNYSSPFEVTGHSFSKLNVSGVSISELTRGNNMFTVLSPVVYSSLKLEFYDTNNVIYLTSRLNDVEMYTPEVIIPDDPPVVDPPGPTIDCPQGYTELYWSDEFDGDKLDKGNWTYETGNGSGGWGNNEAEYYTDSNDFVSDGVLTIRAKAENRGNFNYTSTRIKTQNKVHFTYGYVEARISLPVVTGMWPAFWMMPNDSVYGGWPHSGEIDIMEADCGYEFGTSCAIHYSLTGGSHTYDTGYNNMRTRDYQSSITEFHVYKLDWQEDMISVYVDDRLIKEFPQRMWSTASVSKDENPIAPFDQEFYIILNMAVGGNYVKGNIPDGDFTSAEMIVDYIRVYTYEGE